MSSNQSRKLMLGIVLTALVSALWGCNTGSEPTPDSTLEKSRSNVLLSPFKVTFEGRTVDEESTTFTWILHGTGTEPAQRSFFIQLPECASEPVSFSPQINGLVQHNPDLEMYGVQWTLMTATDDQDAPRFSITFAGDVPLGEVHSVLIGDESLEFAAIAGPCQGDDISGRVFVDANTDGLLNIHEESGIGEVLVELSDDQGNLSSRITDADGNYSFRKLPGTYTLSLNLEGGPEHFNAHLAESFVATTPLIIEATVPPESLDNNFGFDVLYENVVVEILEGDLPTNGYTLAYWQEEFRVALIGDEEPRLYQGRTLQELLVDVEDLLLSTPYSFAPGNELLAAYELLIPDSTAEYHLLESELLATELNYTVNRGLVYESELQLSLMAWGESLLVQQDAPPAVMNDGEFPAGNDLILVEPDVIFQALRVFNIVNTGGGGGIDE